MKNESKKKLRERILTFLREQPVTVRSQKSSQISCKLLKSKEFVESQIILFYASFDGEVETFEMMKQAKKLGKVVVLPVVDRSQKKIIPSVVQSLEDSLGLNIYGIKEPDLKNTNMVNVDDIDLVLVPGVAFDKQNRRVGRGGGYYDRFLTALPQKTPKIGLAFDFQILDSLNGVVEDHDVPVSWVLTN